MERTSHTLSAPGSGAACSISGDTVVVTSVPAQVAYVFVKPAGGWADATATAVLRPASLDPIGSGFGRSVAIDGDTIVVGATSEGYRHRGAAYVFVKPAGGWADMSETAKLEHTGWGGWDSFGSSVAVAGDTIVVGARGADSDSGALYVFEEPAGGWAGVLTQIAKLTRAGATGSQLGFSAAIEGGVIVGGAWESPDCAACVFEKPGTRWRDMSQTATLTSTDRQPGDGLGSAVAIDGDTIVVGDYKKARLSGAAYVFVKSAGGWTDMTQTARLKPPGPAQNQLFGAAVAISGEIVVVGAPKPVVPGAAYVFEKPASGWRDVDATSDHRLADPTGAATTSFGTCVDMDGSAAVISSAWPTHEAFVYPTLDNELPVPLARFLARVIVGERVEFDGTGSSDLGGAIASYAWDFGDGQEARGAIVHHAYAAAGDYSVRLHVTDDQGATVSTPDLPITVVSIPTAIQDLMDAVVGCGLSDPVERSLLNILGDAKSLASRGNTTAAKDKLRAAIKKLEAERGQALTDAQVDALVDLGERIVSLL